MIDEDGTNEDINPGFLQKNSIHFLKKINETRILGIFQIAY
jgi:hypothetical protein